MPSSTCKIKVKEPVLKALTHFINVKINFSGFGMFVAFLLSIKLG